MLDHIMQFRSVVAGAFEYKRPEEVIGSIDDNILVPVEAKLRELSCDTGQGFQITRIGRAAHLSASIHVANAFA